MFDSVRQNNIKKGQYQLVFLKLSQSLNSRAQIHMRIFLSLSQTQTMGLMRQILPRQFNENILLNFCPHIC